MRGLVYYDAEGRLLLLEMSEPTTLRATVLPDPEEIYKELGNRASLVEIDVIALGDNLEGRMLKDLRSTVFRDDILDKEVPAYTVITTLLRENPRRLVEQIMTVEFDDTDQEDWHIQANPGIAG